jgi:outer membrane protein TolC
VKLSRSQRLPDLRLQATYGTAGIAGRKIIRDGFLGPVTGTSTTGFGNALDQVFNRLYPTWSVNLSLTYPLGFSYDQAALANARVQEAQARLRLESAEIKAVRQLRQAAWQLEANVKRIETTRATRAFAEQRLDAEQKRFEVGMSTSFLVIQAQRDLALARNNELAARLEFTRALVDFEALQEAGPATSSGSTMTVSGSSIVSFGAPTTGTTTGASGTASTSGRPGGI